MMHNFLWPWSPGLCSCKVLIRKQDRLCRAHPPPAAPPPMTVRPSWPCLLCLGGAGRAEPQDKHATGDRTHLGNDTQGRLFSSGKSFASAAHPKITWLMQGLSTSGCHQLPEVP